MPPPFYMSSPKYYIYCIPFNGTTTAQGFSSLFGRGAREST